MKAPSAMMLSLMIASMISGVTAPKVKKAPTTTSQESDPTSTSSVDVVQSTTEASSVTCTSDCCRVTYIWQEMGKYTAVSSTNSTACCYYKGSTTQTSGIPGVTCTSAGTVTKIYWNNKGLTGSIPPEIGNLVNLQHLGLSRNLLSGSIPAEIGNLVNLTYLEFYETPVSGSIPPEIGNLVNLRGLYLYSNPLLSGLIPPEIGNLVNLQELYLYSNQLSGSIPAEIGNLVNLKYLYLYNNSLSGLIPLEIGNLVNLTRLILHNNTLSGPIPAIIGNLSYLQQIHLGNNQLSGPIPAIIGNLSYVQQISFASNQLYGTIPASFQSAKRLYYLDLSYNEHLYGTFPFSSDIIIGSTRYPRILNCLGTNVNICGAVAGTSPPSVFPPPETPDACLATGSATSLRKRILAFSQVIGSQVIGTYQYTCHLVINSLNPNQDCFNMMAKICHPDYLGTDSTRIQFCKASVDKMAKSMNPWWQKVRKECGQWPWEGIIGNPNSASCASANLELQNNAYYIVEDTNTRVPAALTDSINRGLWTKLK